MTVEHISKPHVFLINTVIRSYKAKAQQHSFVAAYAEISHSAVTVPNQDFQGSNGYYFLQV